MTSNRSPLRFASWNARGLRNKSGEVELLLDELSIDLLLVCETFLKPENKIRIPGFICYREDRRDKGGGGVAIFIKSSIIHNKIQIPPLHNMEAVGIELKSQHKTYTIISCYNPPEKALLTTELDTLFNIGHSVVAAGDFNAKHTLWGCKSSDRQGTSLFQHITLTDTVIYYPNNHTHHPTNGTQSSTLDIVLTRNVNLSTLPVTCNRLSSDHLPIFFAMNENTLTIQTKIFNYADANWDHFRKYITKNLEKSQSITNTSEIDLNINKLTKVIVSAKNHSVPLKTFHSNRLNIPSYLQSMIREKNKLRKRLRTTGDTSLKRTVNQLTWRIKQIITDIKNDIWSKRLSKISPANGSLWRMTKSLRNNSNSDNFLVKDGNSVSDPRDKAEILANTFQNNHNITKSFYHKSTHEAVSKSIAEIGNYPTTNNFQMVTTREISNIIKSLKNKKSPGHDEIDNRLLKNLPLEAICEITKIFNDCLSNVYFPETWKVARVIAIPKPGKDSRNPTNFRPISLLSSISKLFEKIIYSRLIDALGDKLRLDQHGFRTQHSTIHQLTRLTEDITMGFNKKKSTSAIFLDAEKAFDTVWHDGLLHKLTQLNTPSYLVQIVQSYLKNRKFYVTINGKNSNIKQIPAGVAQGSVISPLLYIVYVNDIPVPRHCKISLYADDTACYASGKNPEVLTRRLQTAHDTLLTYYNKWKIKINTNKTDAIFFTTRRHWPLSNIISSSGVDILWKNQVKYLGLTLDTRLRWGPHTLATRNKALAALSALYPIFNRKSSLSLKNKTTILKSIIRPILTYGAPVWSNLSKTNANKLQIVQNKCIKIIYNTPILTNLTKIHKINKIPSIKDYCHKLTSAFYTKTTNVHTNTLIRELGNYDLRNLNFKYKHRLPKHILIQ
jgi:Reverse transcriptase (RNA-dependent DNA polymerase)/Endonuclease-reverse transcriptase